MQNKNLSTILIISSLLLLTSGAALVSFVNYQRTKDELQNYKQNPEQAVAKELVEKIKHYVELPTDEVPHVYTIEDITKYKNNSFFVNAKNGDKLLVYEDSKRSILYRPYINKIIETAAINVMSDGDASKETENTETVAGQTDIAKEMSTIESANTETSLATEENITDLAIENIRIAVLNSTQEVGKATQMAEEIKQELDNYQIEIVDISDAKISQTKNAVINLTRINETLIQELANLIDADVTTLPEGEVTIEADVLVIVGQNYL